MHRVGERPLNVAVVGPARGGFTMCIHVLHQFVARLPDGRDLGQRVLNETVRAMGPHFGYAMRRAFASHGIADELIFNKNFERTLGGPKWLADDDGDICVRKYVGVPQMGDFTIAARFPFEVFGEDNVIHSHIQPERWLRHPQLRSHRKFMTLRHPVGILNSACFSINPLTSEYIQRFAAERLYDDKLRQDLAAFKLTHPDFLHGLVSFQKDYWAQALEVCDAYDHLMRWEDIIDDPVPTILELGRACDLDVSTALAQRIWDEMSHRNLTMHHLHNYRQGEGRVGGWRTWLTNEHLDLFESEGLVGPLARFGYAIERLREDDYTPFQRRVSNALQSGRVLDDVRDRTLFGFAFNKSNLVSDKFPFRRYGWKTHTRIERSDFRDPGIEQSVWDALEVAVGTMRDVFDAVLEVDFRRPRTAVRGLRDLGRRFADLEGPCGPRLMSALEHGSELARVYFAPHPLDLPCPTKAAS